MRELGFCCARDSQAKRHFDELGSTLAEQLRVAANGVAALQGTLRVGMEAAEERLRAATGAERKPR